MIITGGILLRFMTPIVTLIIIDLQVSGLSEKSSFTSNGTIISIPLGYPS
jgi:hypothetical protein